MEKFFNPFGGSGGSGGGGGKVNNYVNGGSYDQERICSFTDAECIYDTSSTVDYGNRGAKVLERLRVNDEAALTSYQANYGDSDKAVYDSESKIGAYAGYIFNAPKFIQRVKIWVSRFIYQQYGLTITIQYLDENDNWIDYCDYVVSTTIGCPSNVFDLSLYIGKEIKGIRWYHYKTPKKESSTNIIFTGMTVYEGYGNFSEYYCTTGESKTVPVPSGYTGFGDIMIAGEKTAALINKNITSNGTYNATTDGVDGYSKVVVNVPPPDRYMTIDEVNNNGEPTKIHFYAQPGDTFNYFQPDVNTSYPQAFKKATEIVLDENYTSFGQPNTFCNRSNLVSVNLPSQITVIPSSTFKGCQSLTDSYNLSTITEVGQYAFYQCYLADIYADLSNLTRIEDHAFESCKAMEYVKITNNTTYIGQRTFYECINMNGDFDLSGVITIDDAAFQYCESIDQPLNLTNVSAIDQYTFDGCKKVPSITLANNWTFVSGGSYAFRNCEALTSITHFGSSVTTIPSNAFQNCKNLTTSFDLSNITTINGNAFDGCEKIPSFILGKINNIGSYAFRGCKKITSIDFSNSTFTTLSAAALANCTSLQSITFPSVLTSINTECFRNCTSLSEIDLSNLTSFSWPSFNNGYIYAGCTSLTTVKYPASKEIRFYNHDFDGCENLTTLVIPASSSVKTVSTYAFAGTGFTELPSIFQTVTQIPDHCFDGSKIQTLTIPDGITLVGNNAFANCKDLTTINFPTNTITFSGSNFINCDSLVSVRIPPNVKMTGMNMFETEVGASGIQTVYVEDRASLGTYTFRNNNSITDAYFAWSYSQSSSRFGLRSDVTIHYDWDPNAED